MQGPSGFLLVIEGGAIDTAHHNAQIKRALEETVELEEAVQTVLDAVDSEETLGGNSIEKKSGFSFCLKNGLTFHFDSVTCLGLLL